MLIVGVDENGMGPRLGPMVATAVACEVPAYDRARLRRNGLRAGIHDSKETSAFGRMAHAESIALALVERLSGSRPRDADAFLGAIALAGLGALREPCPGASAPQCWAEPLPLPAFGGDAAAGHRVLDRVARWGVAIRRLRSEVLCVRRLNRELRRHSKLDVDLAMFERLLLDARASHGELYAVCGMVGGMRRYAGRFRHLGDRRVEVLEEGRHRSAYAVEGLGRVSFEVDADGGHLPVALASMVGKYVREVAMERQNRFYLRYDDTLPRPSGYRDPVTRRFIHRSASLRRRLRIAPDCFRRVR